MSRRALLKGFGAGAAALAAAPAILPATRAAATTATRADLPPPGALAGLHGATLSLAAFPAKTTWAEAIPIWEGYTGTTIEAAKVYYGAGVFPTSISGEIQAYIDQGIKALLAFKPIVSPPSETQRAALARALQMFASAGLNATVTLWQEPQNVMSAEQFLTAIYYYGPTVRAYYPLAYDAAGSAGPSGWTAYYLGEFFFDVIAVDYYAPHYLKGIKLDTIAGLASTAYPPKPFGIWEMGNTAGVGNPTPSQMQSYFSYIQSFMAGRLQAGMPNAEIAWYNGNGIDTISSSSDYRVPLWDSLVNATS